MLTLSGMEAAVGVALLLVIWIVYRFHISTKYPNFTMLDLVMHNGRFDKFSFWFSVWNSALIFFVIHMSQQRLMTEGYLGLVLTGAFGPLAAKILKGAPPTIHSESTHSSETTTSTGVKP